MPIKSPFTKEKIDKLVDLECKFASSKISEDIVVALMQTYSVNTVLLGTG